MPLFAIPKHIHISPILIDCYLSKSYKNKLFNPENDSDDESFKSNDPLSSLEYKNKSYAAPLLILSEKGRTLFPQNQQDNSFQAFVRKENICTYETFLNTVKSGSLEKLKQLNFISNHLHAKDEDGNNALHIATLFNFTDIMKYILTVNKYLDNTNINGWRAIDIAVAQGFTNAVAILLENGACKEMNAQLCSSFNFAIEIGHIEIAEMIQNQIALNAANSQAQRQSRVMRCV